MPTTIVRPGHTFTHDPDAELFYGVEWASWLPEGAEIASATWEIEDTDETPEDPLLLTQDNDTIVDGTMAQVRLLGGTAGRKYRITVHITTNESPSQKDDRSFFLKVKER
jgi:hypothetical protein